METPEEKTRSQISRRDFLKAAGIGAGAVVAMGGATELLTSCTKSAAVKWDMTTDIVVIGSGAAASAAAATASNQGAAVIMLEKSTAIGGTTLKSGGEAWIPNNFALRAQGTQDNKDDCLRFMARGNYPQLYNPNDAQLGLPKHEYNNLAAFYDNGYKAIDFFMQIGACQFTQQSPALPDYLDHVPENKVLRGRGVFPKTANGSIGFGAELISQFSAYIKAHNIQVLTGHRVQQILLNEKNEVVGVQALTSGKTLNVQGKKAVIFGSGGFTHNPELIIQFQKGPTYGGCAVITNEGDLVYMAQAIGAQLSNMTGAWNAEIPLEPALQSPSTPNDVWQPAGDSMILVNKYGVRVTDEKRAYNDRTKIHFYWDPIQQEYPNQVMLMIYDQRTRDLYASAPGGYPIPTPGTSATHEISGQTFQELGQNIRARITQLAAKLGEWRLDDNFEKNLQTTLTRFNQFANAGVDDDFHRGAFPYDVEWHKTTFSIPATGTKWPPNDKPNITMYPFTAQGPYYCILLGGGTLDTNGGPKINELAQILDTKDNPIPGLYGAGNCIAAPMPYYMAGGATIGPALTFGYVAGMNAAKEPVKRA